MTDNNKFSISLYDLAIYPSHIIGFWIPFFRSCGATDEEIQDWPDERQKRFEERTGCKTIKEFCYNDCKNMFAKDGDDNNDT